MSKDNKHNSTPWSHKHNSWSSKKPTLYLTSTTPFAKIKSIKDMENISKDLRIELDKEWLLDAKRYLLRYFVLDNTSFIKQHLGKQMNYEDLTIDQIYYLIDIFKTKVLTLEERDEELYAITSYAYIQYKNDLSKKKGITPLTIIKEHEKEKLSDYTSIDNELINKKYNLNQTFWGEKIKDLVNRFFEGWGQKLSEMMEDLRLTTENYTSKGIYDTIKQFCSSKQQLLTFIKQTTKPSKEDGEIQTILFEFFRECYSLYTNVQSIQKVVTYNSKTYQDIKDHINTFVSHTTKGNYEFFDATTKKEERIFDKIVNKYDGDLSHIKDIIRCSFVFSDINHLVGWLQSMFHSFHHNEKIFNIITKDKNGNPLIEVDDKIGLILKKPIKQSWYRDITLVVHFQSETWLIPMEIQVHLKDMYTMKQKGMPWVYSSLIHEEIITDSEIKWINRLLSERGSVYFLPTDDNEIVSSDQIYAMRRLFQEDQKLSEDQSPSKKEWFMTRFTKTAKKAIVSVFGWWKDATNQVVSKKLATIESRMNNFARKKVLDKINLPPKYEYSFRDLWKKQKSEEIGIALKGGKNKG